MVITEFKKLVSSYLARDRTLFANGVDTDKLLLAANNAKLYAQRKLDFELARVTVDVTVSSTNGADLSTAVLHGTNTVVDVKKLERAFLPSNDPNTFFPVPIIGREAHIKMLERKFENLSFPKAQDLRNQTVSSQSSVVRNGNTVYVWPWFSNTLTSAQISMDVLRWMPPYVDTGTTQVVEDFFLIYCTDWMLWRCVQELNLYLKEDQRVYVSSKILDDAWETIKEWNMALSLAKDDLPLD